MLEKIYSNFSSYFRGVIYYAPKTSFTDEVMEKVDEKFGRFHELEFGINSITNILHRTRKWLRNHSEEIGHTIVKY